MFCIIQIPYNNNNNNNNNSNNNTNNNDNNSNNNLEIIIWKEKGMFDVKEQRLLDQK